MSMMKPAAKLRLVFMGTPAFAVPSLKALWESGCYEILCVTQPDQPSGRGLKLSPCACKLAAKELGLDVFCFERVSRPSALAVLGDFSPHFIVTVAFGQLLKESVLNLPKIACVNVHPSLLPKYRGPCPINWSIIRGEKETGITTMLMDKGMDTGDILLQRATPIGEEETAAELYERLSLMGADLLSETLVGLAEGRIVPRKQDHSHATYAPKLTKRDGLIDWSKPPEQLVNYVRGLQPWPGTYTYYRGRILKVSKLRPVETPLEIAGCAAGTVVAASPRAGLVVKTNPGAVSIEILQPPGRRQMTAREFLAGNRVEVGQRFTAAADQPAVDSQPS